MKTKAKVKGKNLLIGMLLVTSLLFVGYSTPVDAKYFTNREDISVSSGTCDINAIDNNLYMPAGGAGSNISGNLTLPCIISEMTKINISVYNGETSNIVFNLTVNGVKYANGSINLTAGSTRYFNMTNYTTGGGDVSLSYFAWSGNCSQSDDEFFNITLLADDANMISGFISSTFTSDEKDKATPMVSKNLAHACITVEDRLKATQSLAYNITDVNCTLSYPSHATSRPYTYHVFSTLVPNTQSTWAMGYQKRGPYIYDIDYESNKATIRVKGFETLTTVGWSIDPTDDFYADYFPNINYNTLEVKKSGSNIDWEQGSIEMEELTLTSSIATFTFEWTPTVAPVIPTAEEVAWYNEYVGPLPVWSVLIILAFAVLAVGYIGVYLPSKSKW